MKEIERRLGSCHVWIATTFSPLVRSAFKTGVTSRESIVTSPTFRIRIAAENAPCIQAIRELMVAPRSFSFRSSRPTVILYTAPFCSPSCPAILAIFVVSICPSETLEVPPV